MNSAYGRDLDLNLLRVFVVVAEAGSVTAAAARLYLTQPAISAALRRLNASVGGALFARAGRGLALTARGERLLEAARPHLDALIGAALSPARFDPALSERTVRIGLSDASEGWLLPTLVRVLGREAPRMRVVVLPVQFRTVAEALSTGRVDLAVTVADELPAGTHRETLLVGGFTCVIDPRHVKLRGRALSKTEYLAREHVIVSYNGDLRGIVEDVLGLQRRVRVSVPSFASVGALVEGTAMIATVPGIVAAELVRAHPKLATAALPIPLRGTPLELVWRHAVHDDDAVAFVRGHIERIANVLTAGDRPRGHPSRCGQRPRARDRLV